MVNRPSWQAQLSGQKIWTLIPPPECEHVCKSMQVTMNKGEISKLGWGRDRWALAIGSFLTLVVCDLYLVVFFYKKELSVRN